MKAATSKFFRNLPLQWIKLISILLTLGGYFTEKKKGREKKVVYFLMPLSWKSTLLSFPWPNFPPLPWPGTVSVPLSWCIWTAPSSLCCTSCLASSKSCKGCLRSAEVRVEGSAAERWPQAGDIGSSCHCKAGCSLCKSSTVLHPSAYPGKVLTSA